MNKIFLPLCAMAISFSAGASNLRYTYTLSSPVPYDWQVIEPSYGDWIDVGDPYSCSNWSPSTGTVGKNISFIQNATDCQQNQSRTVQSRHQDSRTDKIENDGIQYTVSRTITVSQNRNAVGILENWSYYTPTYTDWTNTNALYGCTNWTPDPSIYKTTTNFTQSSSTCKTDQERQRQDREQEKYTSEIRNSGTPVTEDQTLKDQSAQRPYSVKLGDWTNVGGFYDCSNWSPDPSTVGKGVAFTQTATDCKISQSRTRAESYVDNQTGKTVNVDKANETQILSGQTNTQPSVGTREDWTATDSTYTAWTNVAGKVLYSCSNWSPAGSSKVSSSTFTQVASDCSTDQSRMRQNREEETNTGEIRNSGSPIVETQTLTAQSASRTYTVTLGSWTNSGATTNCSNWSPDPSTQTINATFTQTATDCSQAQTRSRAESYIDHISGSTIAASNTTEAQTITATSTRQATGTKETWVTTSSTYTAWANTTAAYGCTSWSPSPSNYSAQTQFTQTGTGCSIDQSRTRQDRQAETTTGAVRNTGNPVSETQTVGGQTSSRTYLMDFSSWTDSGGYYNCSAWTPDASTVASGTSFTQSANCNINQTRGAAGYILVNGAWSSDPAVPYRTETQSIARTINQTSTGTMVTQECYATTSTKYSVVTNTKGVTHWFIIWNGSVLDTQSSYQMPRVINGYTYTSPNGNTSKDGTYTICRQ